MNYEEKYLKYKKKYLDLKESTDNLQIGGSPDINTTNDSFYINILQLLKKFKPDSNLQDFKRELLLLINQNKNITEYLNTTVFITDYPSIIFEQLKPHLEAYCWPDYINKKNIKTILIGERLSFQALIDKLASSFMKFMILYFDNYGYEINIKKNIDSSYDITYKPTYKDEFEYESQFETAYFFLKDLYTNEFKYIYEMFPAEMLILKKNSSSGDSSEQLKQIAEHIYTLLKKSTQYEELFITNKDAIECALLKKHHFDSVEYSSITGDDLRKKYTEWFLKRMCLLMNNYFIIYKLYFSNYDLLKNSTDDRIKDRLKKDREDILVLLIKEKNKFCFYYDKFKLYYSDLPSIDQIKIIDDEHKSFISSHEFIFVGDKIKVSDSNSKEYTLIKGQLNDDLILEIQLIVNALYSKFIEFPVYDREDPLIGKSSIMYILLEKI